MSRTALFGWELGGLTAEQTGTVVPTTTGGGCSLDTGIVRNGTYSLKVVAGSGAANNWNGGGISSGYVRFYVYPTSFPSSARELAGGAAAGRLCLVLRPDGLIYTYINGIGGTIQNLGTHPLILNQWNKIEVGAFSATTSADLYINDVLDQVGVGSGSSVSFLHIFGASDTVAASYTAYFDDFAADSAGFCGTGAVRLLVPTSLSAAGGWVEGDGAGTAGMAAAVATRPPPGVASASETAATNIESPTNSATDNCDMNMTTYLAAGITGKVNGVRSVIRHGEDIVTGTKAGASLIVSNPTQSVEDAFNFGDDLAAHGVEPTGWRTILGSVQSDPVIVPATAPVLRVGKRTATTRVVCVDFMGIYVDFTPAPIKIRKNHQAVARAANY